MREARRPITCFLAGIHRWSDTSKFPIRKKVRGEQGRLGLALLRCLPTSFERCSYPSLCRLMTSTTGSWLPRREVIPGTDCVFDSALKRWKRLML